MLPLIVFVNGQPIGMMRGDNVTLEMPDGEYNIAVKLMFQLWKWRLSIGGERIVSVVEEWKLLIQLHIS